MRTQRVFAALTQALRRSAQRAPERFRVVQFSIQADHVHLLVEATGKAALSRGVQGLCISMARRVNRVLGRRGRFWADRFHARSLESPRSVRNALVYILANFRKHARRRFAAGIDCFSSAAFFVARALRCPRADLARTRGLASTWLDFAARGTCETGIALRGRGARLACI
jgi:putative transposase